MTELTQCPRCGYDLTHPAGSLSYEVELPENAQAINLLTYQMKEKLWWTNLAQNFAQVRDMPDIRELPGRDGEAAMVVGAGPTIQKQLGEIAKFDGAVFATDRMLIPLLKAGIVPEFVGTIDGEPVVAKYYDDPIVEQHRDEIKVVLDTFTVSPATLRVMPPKRWGIICFQDDPIREHVSVTRGLHFMLKKTVTQIGGNIGAGGWFILYILGFSDIGLAGLDFGYPPGTPAEKTAYYDAWMKMIKVKSEQEGQTLTLDQFYRTVHNPDTDSDVLVDLVFDVYADIFKKFVAKAKDKVTTYNLSPASALFGEGVTAMRIEDFVERCKDGRYKPG